MIYFINDSLYIYYITNYGEAIKLKFKKEKKKKEAYLRRQWKTLKLALSSHLILLEKEDPHQTIAEDRSQTHLQKKLKLDQN